MLFEQFVKAHPVPPPPKRRGRPPGNKRKAAPTRVVLDFDATDVPLHGMQAGRHYHGHYRSYCYLPLYVFSGRHLLAAALQPSGRDTAWWAGAVLKLLVDALRAEWPGVEVVLRGDCGFCRPRPSAAAGRPETSGRPPMPDLEPTAKTGEFYFGTFGEFSIGIDRTSSPHGWSKPPSPMCPYRSG